MKFLVRYSEIALKSDYVRNTFENALIVNIKWRFRGEGAECRVSRDWARIYVESEYKGAARILESTFGIHSLSPVVSCKSEMEDIEETALRLWAPKGEFAISVRRPYKRFPLKTPEIEKRLGALLQKKTGAKVNLDDPEELYSLVVNKERTDFFTETRAGAGGLPYGTQGRVLALLEDEDSVEAALLAVRRGCAITPLFVGREKPKLLKKLLKVGPIGKSVVVGDESGIPEAMKIAGALAVVTNETVDTIKRRDFPVLRPLVGRRE